MEPVFGVFLKLGSILVCVWAVGWLIGQVIKAFRDTDH